MNFVRYIFCVFFQTMTLSAICQKENIRFEHLGTDQGLSQSNVICILQDHRGFMWFGTRDGLNKYDGYNFTVYKNDAHDRKSLTNNFIKTLFEDKSGDIWIGTIGGGLSRFDCQKNVFTNFQNDPKNPNSISDNLVNSVVEDRKGNIWIGTQRGLNMFDKEKIDLSATIITPLMKTV